MSWWERRYRLLCAWCGEPLSVVECVLHESLACGQRWGWHHECHDQDPLADRAIAWGERYHEIVSRGPGRVGTIERGER